MNIRRRAMRQGMIPTASMADIAMLLLIFFLSTAIFRSNESMEVRLPGAYSGERMRREQMIRVWIGPGGEVTFNDARVAPDRVGELLGGKLAGNPGLVIALRADERVPYERIAAMLDQLKAARAPRVAFTTAWRPNP